MILSHSKYSYAKKNVNYINNILLQDVVDHDSPHIFLIHYVLFGTHSLKDGLVVSH